MDSHQQQQESPRAKTGVEDGVSGLLLGEGNFTDKSPPPRRLWPHVLPNDLKGHAAEDSDEGRLRSVRLLDDN